MHYKILKELPAARFRRRTGVKRTTFERMVEIVKAYDEKRRKGLGGRPPKLAVEDQVLMTLAYLREYRTYFHIGTDWGMSESNCFGVIRRIETALTQSRVFALPRRTEGLLLSTDDVAVLERTLMPTKVWQGAVDGAGPALQVSQGYETMMIDC